MKASERASMNAGVSDFRMAPAIGWFPKKNIILTRQLLKCATTM